MTNSKKESDNNVWIDMFDPLCVSRWTNRLNVSEAELFEITRTVGGYAQSVQKYVESHHAMFPSHSEN